MRCRKLCCGFLAAVLMITATANPCLADQFDDKISNMQQQEAATQETISNLEKQTQATKESIEQLKEQKKNTEENVNNLKDKSENLKDKIEVYSDQLDDLDGEIEDAEDAMTEVSAQIVELNKQLAEIRKQIEDRKQLLKHRMKSVYEKGGSRGMLAEIVSGGSARAVLNRYVYMDAMITYDKQKIAECQALEKELEETTAKVSEKEAEINAYQDELDSKYSELSNLNAEAKGMLGSTNSSINAEAGKIASYDAQLTALDNTMKSLESQVAAAQAKLAQQIAERLALKREDTGGSYAASASELEWLAATIQAEAGGESYTGKLAVGSVIMNRVKSSAFPNTVTAVITQNLQFASYRSGKVEFIISQGANSTCIKAAQEVLGGARVGDYLFFMTQKWADYYRIAEYEMIGNHAFFYRWVVKEPEPEPVVENPEQPAPEEGQPPAEQPPAEQPPAEQPPAEEGGQDQGGENGEGGGEQ
ncbi:MAG: cell wall hydrolase [Lachnospiraceae bacterium]|nr:cell wall hydrolase [Lachnospiraceae bacterium]